MRPGRRVGRVVVEAGARLRRTAARPIPRRRGLRPSDHRVALEGAPQPSGSGSPSAVSASSIDTIATSIMSSVGCLVVIIWTRIPGT